jgi:alpha-tubulin suppressor-like RCC1 family protein
MGQAGAATSVPVVIGAGFASVTVGDHAVATKADGTVWAWGSNRYGKLGIGRVPYRTAPLPAVYMYPELPSTEQGFISLTAGSEHMAAVGATTGTLYVWGSNEFGQLGVLGYLSTTAIDFVLRVPSFGSYVSVGTGDFHTIVVKSGGDLLTFGANESGQLGDGTKTSKGFPVKVGEGFASADGGWAHTVAVGANGTLWTWGSNAGLWPVHIGDGFTQASAGRYHTAALKADGTLWTSGYNYYGQLGRGVGPDTWLSTPGLVGGDFVFVSAGANGTVAIKSNGDLWEWSPERQGYVAGGFVSAAIGDSHRLGLKPDGTLWAWGSANYFGQQGTGGTSASATPVLVGTGFVSVAAGEKASVAVKEDGTLWTWGSNYMGQLADDKYIDRGYPTRVLLP